MQSPQWTFDLWDKDCNSGEVSETVSAPSPNQCKIKKQVFILGAIVEMSDTLKDLKDVEVVVPIIFPFKSPQCNE